MNKDNFIGQEFLQNCGDILKVLKVSEKRDKWGRTLYDAKFINHPYLVSVNKQHIQRGVVDNPQIEIDEFINKEWPQKCGDTLIVLEKTNQRTNNGKGNLLFKCQFKNYPCEVLAVKSHIKEGCVNNPQIEIKEFIEKEWLQNCGDSIKILKKTNQKRGGEKEFLFEGIFINYPYKVLASKSTIIAGQIENPNLPWKTKENLKKYIEENYLNKPTLNQLAKDLNVSRQKLGQNLIKFNLQNYINYWIGNQEKSLKEYIESLMNVSCNSYNKEKYEIDIYIPTKNLGFEFNGNYWHSNLFKENNYHQEKTLFFKERGISLIHIFEFEWLNKENICKSIIKSKLGLYNVKIGARQCQIKEIDTKKYQDFCNKNHLQGEAGARVKLGLFYKEELVQIMSFGSPRFNLNFEWEIIRECSKLGWFIIGGKQKLWKYFIENYSPNNCITYCDFSKFTGNSYLKLGFKEIRLNKPGFWWYDEENKEIYWRNPIKHLEMKNKGYLQLYDCGQLIFEWYK